MATSSAATRTVAPARVRPGILGGGLSRGAGVVLLGILLVLVGLLSLAAGARDVEPAQVIAALTGSGDPADQVIVRELRLPRLFIGIAVGSALGLAGMLMQGLTRNPVADPGILGVSAGSTLMVVIAIALLGVTDASGYLWFALAGAALASALVFGLGSMGRGRGGPATLTLAGAVMTALLTAVTTTILVLDDATFERFRFWEVGSLAGRDLEVLTAVLPVILVGTVVALLAGRALNTLSLGSDLATALGQRVLAVRIAVAAAIVLLAGAAVAAAGPIVFVGLAVPHVARSLVGPDYRWLAIYCLILGPILLVAADTVGRLVIRPGELQVGIVTALVGAPLFIALVRRRGLAEV